MAFDPISYARARAAAQPRRLMVSRIGYPNEFLRPATVGTATGFGQELDLIASPHADWSAIEFVFGNFGINYDDGPNNVTLSLAIRVKSLADGASVDGYIPIIWENGSRTIAIEPGMTARGRVDVTIPAGSTFWLRYFAIVPTNGQWATCDLNFWDTVNNGRYEVGSPPTDKTLSGSIAGAAGARVAFPPLAITGIPSTVSSLVNGQSLISVAIIGDSISVGAGESTATKDRGFIVRAISNSYPWTHLGQSGQNVNAYFSTPGVSSGRLRRRAAALQGITHALCNLGTNDIGTAVNRTAEQLIADYGLLNLDMQRRGIKLIPMTIGPRTNVANDGGFYVSPTPITDTSVQWDRRATFNAWVKTNPFGNGFFDASAFAQDPVNVTRWRSDLGSPSADGLHPSPAIHAAMGVGLAAAIQSLLV